MGQEPAFHYCSISGHSAGLTPNLLMRERETRLPAEFMPGKTTSEGVLYHYGEYVENIRQRLLRAHEVARKHLRQAAHHQRETYDIMTSQHHYEEGQLVWYLNETRKEGICPKYQPTYLGPCVITRKFYDFIFNIFLNQFDSRFVHNNKLKKYEGDKKPK